MSSLTPTSFPAALVRLLVLVAALRLVAGPAAAEAQLRPLEPLDWTALGRPGASLSVGVSYLHGQRASLAGTEGTLWELGDAALYWNVGRAVLLVSGTSLWVYEDQDRFAPPVGGARPPDGTRRVDIGAFLVETVLFLTPSEAERALALRFGTRLPTTDNAVGLGRDVTDFVSTLAGRLDHGRWRFSAEAGLAVVGTRDPENEQVDPLLFAGGVRYRTGGSVVPFLDFAGQHDTRAGREPRGNENLGEARAGVRVGGARWFQAEVVRGWTRTGPEVGVRLRVGTRF